MAPFLKSLADISKVYPNVDVQVVSYYFADVDILSDICIIFLII